MSENSTESANNAEQEFHLKLNEVGLLLEEEDLTDPLELFVENEDEACRFVYLLHGFISEKYSAWTHGKDNPTDEQYELFIEILQNINAMANEITKSEYDKQLVDTHEDLCKSLLIKANMYEDFLQFKIDTAQGEGVDQKFIEAYLDEAYNYKPKEGNDAVINLNKQILAAKVREDIIKKRGDAMAALNKYIIFAYSNTKAWDAVKEALPETLAAKEKLERSDISNLNNEELTEQIIEINKLTNSLFNEEVEYQYELERLCVEMQRQDFSNFIRGLFAPDFYKKSQKSLQQIEDLERTTSNVSKKQLSAAIRDTTNYLQKPSQSNFIKLQQSVNNLPEKSKASFYFKVMLACFIGSALLTGVIVASIYFQPASQLMQPIYSSVASFFNNLLSTIPPLSTMISSVATPIQEAGMQTAFMIPNLSPYAGGQPVPVWSLVAGGVGGALIASGGLQAGKLLIEIDKKVNRFKANYKPLSQDSFSGSDILLLANQPDPEDEDYDDQELSEEEIEALKERNAGYHAAMQSLPMGHMLRQAYESSFPQAGDSIRPPRASENRYTVWHRSSDSATEEEKPSSAPTMIKGGDNPKE